MPRKSSSGSAENLFQRNILYQLFSAGAPYIMATVHPSAILRAPDDETRHLEHRHFVNDLKKLARILK